MDNIRATIDTLFSQINSTSILNAYLNIQSYTDMLGVSEDMFCQKFMVENKCYTQDQVRELFRLLQSEWIQKPRNSFATVTKSNLFYILCHYTKDVLSEDDHQPVCRYSQMLRWRMLTYKLGEDIFTTSFLAFRDAQTFLPKRDFFLWPSVIRQDNPSIDHVLEKGVTDLHFHFWGSSLNYELNWLSLMNNITSRSHEFTQLRNCLSYKTSTVDKEKWDSFYLVTIKACAIRFYLYLLLMGDKGAGMLKEIKESLNTILHTENETPGAYVSACRSMLQSCIRIIKREHALSGFVADDMRSLDYAIPSLKWRQEESDLSVTLLSGERWLMYNLFYRIYRHEASLEEQFLFYIYLLQKTQLRKELIQLNDQKGFRNFSEYERRKCLFIDHYPAYTRLMPRIIIDNAFSSGYLKYLECRITPKDDSVQLYRTVKEIDDRVGRKECLEPFKFFYILHFIKEEDKEQKHTSDKNYACRHFQLRRRIMKQGKATLKALKDYPYLRKRIIGIDAANTELYCRPEVFGPIYRYMNRFPSYENMDAHGHSLNFTYHVGEDFWDITDGLRAIDEAILFLNMGANDRLGHALALGTDVKQYYKFRNNRVVMSKQHLLDNAVWLLCKSRDFGINLSANIVQMLEEQFFHFYDEIYGYDCLYKEIRADNTWLEGRNVYTYYQSWMLRGDDPKQYCRRHYKPDDCINTLWDLTALNECNTKVIDARKRESVRLLYYRYHYDAQVRRIGSEKHEMIIHPEIIGLIEKVQHKMCHEIASLHLGIEANLTSNQFIGSMNKYIQHPIVRLNQMGLKCCDAENLCPQMSVSINTDDRGIFDISIEQEYALLALALEKEIDDRQEKRYQPRHVYQWLDNIREMGFEQKFNKDDRKRELCSKSWSRCSMRKRPK